MSSRLKMWAVLITVFLLGLVLGVGIMLYVESVQPDWPIYNLPLKLENL